MNATIAPPQTSPKLRARPVEEERAKDAERPVDASSRAIRLWAATLGVPFTLGAFFFAAAIGTGDQWLIGPAVVLGPILMMFALIFLCISSDTNGRMS